VLAISTVYCNRSCLSVCSWQAGSVRTLLQPACTVFASLWALFLFLKYWLKLSLLPWILAIPQSLTPISMGLMAFVPSPTEILQHLSPLSRYYHSPHPHVNLYWLFFCTTIMGTHRSQTGLSGKKSLRQVPDFFTCWMPFLLPRQHSQGSDGKIQ